MERRNGGWWEVEEALFVGVRTRRSSNIHDTVYRSFFGYPGKKYPVEQRLAGCVIYSILSAGTELFSAETAICNSPYLNLTQRRACNIKSHCSLWFIVIHTLSRNIHSITAAETAPQTTAEIPPTPPPPRLHRRLPHPGRRRVLRPQTHSVLIRRWRLLCMHQQRFPHRTNLHSLIIAQKPRILDP